MMDELEQVLGKAGLTIAVVSLVGIAAVAMLVSVGHWVIRAEAAMQPAEVRRRAALLRRRMAEQRIATIGAETRAAIEEVAERRRRDGLARQEHDGPVAEVPRVRQVH